MVASSAAVYGNEHCAAEPIRRRLQGKLDVNYLPQGLRCDLTTRLSNLRS